MNFTEISTVNDLIKENEKKSLYEIAEDAAGELSYAEGKRLAQYLLCCLGSMHEETAKEELEAGNTDSATAWFKDEQKLHTAWDLLNSVEIND